MIMTCNFGFGEVKFHARYKAGIDSVLKNISKAISDDYLERNVFAISNQVHNLNCSGSKIETIINKWQKNPKLKIVEELQQHKMKLVYPIMLLFDEDKTGYDSSIKKIPEYIEKEHKSLKFNIGIDYSIFFILIPLQSVKNIKKDVIKWIESKKPLLS